MLGPEMAHLIAGGVGGTVAALITSPLEVVKVRLQASKSRVANVVDDGPLPKTHNKYTFFANIFKDKSGIPRPGVIQSIKLIIRTEGAAGLFKGVGPTLVGVIPSRSVYFSSYYYAQSHFNEIFVPDSPGVFFCSAAVSSAISSTITNPVWYIKTRLQLDFGAGNKKLTIIKIIKTTYKEKGIRGFYRGVTASYAGISETGINFMIYENLKVKFLTRFHQDDENNDTFPTNDDYNHLSKLQHFTDMFVCMAASLLSKTFATTIAYPHEVARTRLREEGNKYTGFFQTLRLVFKEDGFFGLYRGLFTHYLRQVPNTCIVMGVYEGIVLLFDKWGLRESQGDDEV